MHELQVAVEPPPPILEGPFCGLVVVRPRADPDPERESTFRDLVDAGGLLRQQDRVPRRGEQDVREQTDPLGDGGGRGMRDQRLVRGERDPVDGRERGEPSLLGPPGPVDEQPPVERADRVG
jgi:hypothetical protein